MSVKASIKEIAELACLNANNNEDSVNQNSFDRILGFVDSLESVNTEGVEPMVTPHQVFSPLREDKVSRDLTREQVLANAPELKDHLFQVPPVV